MANQFVKFKLVSTRDIFKIFKRLNSDLSRNTLIDPSFGLNEGQKNLQSVAYNFAVNEMRPFMRDWDEKETLPLNVLRKGAELGFGSLCVPEKYGGAGLSRLEASVVLEALSQGCVSTTAYISIHNMCVSLLVKHGNEAQKAKYLPKLISMESLASYCLTEPDSGSDASSLKTKAKKIGNEYELNGTKAFISNGGDSDVYFIMCRTGDLGPKGVSCFIVEKNFPGISYGKKEKKMGWNSQPTRMVILENCRVPSENMLGKVGNGMRMALDALNGGRINISSCSLGGAQRAVEDTLRYTNERKQFGSKIISFQHTQFQIAKFAAELFAARTMVRSVAEAYDLAESLVSKAEEETYSNTIQMSVLSAAAKLKAADTCAAIIDGCLQMHGGYGFLYDYSLQQLYRDCRAHRIVEGTQEIMNHIIAESFNKKLKTM